VKCVTTEKPNVTTPPNSTIYVTLQIAIERANHKTKNPLVKVLKLENLHDPYTNNIISEPLIFYRFHPQIEINFGFI
jgi:flagellar basal body-associated protein FliL